MRGRKVSDDTVRIVRDLRRRGFSLRQIARKAKTSRSSVYRLTKGISWERNSVQPRLIEVEKMVPRGRVGEAARRVTEPHVIREAVQEEKSGLDLVYADLMRNRVLRRSLAEEQRAALTCRDKEELELDEAEVYVKTTRAARLYKYLDFQNCLDAMDSEDRLEKYRELRKKTLAGTVIFLRLRKKYGS